MLVGGKKDEGPRCHTDSLKASGSAGCEYASFTLNNSHHPVSGGQGTEHWWIVSFLRHFMPLVLHKFE